jgi:hypothetical protein
VNYIAQKVDGGFQIVKDQEGHAPVLRVTVDDKNNLAFVEQCEVQMTWEEYGEFLNFLLGLMVSDEPALQSAVRNIMDPANRRTQWQ